MKLKFPLIIVCLAGSALVSYMHQHDIRMFYLRQYHLSLKKTTPEKALSTAGKLLSDRKYEALRDYSSSMSALFPDNNALKKFLGIARLELGDRIPGAGLILEGMEEPEEDEALYHRAISVFFEEGLYHNIIAELEKNPPGADPVLHYFMGVSFFHTGNYRRSLDHLKKSEDRGNTSPEMYYYTGLCHEHMNEVKQAIGSMEESFRLDRYAPKTREALVRLYGKTGDYARAERIVRMKRY